MMNEPPSEIRPDIAEIQSDGKVAPASASESARPLSALPALARPRRGRLLIGLSAMLIVGLIFGAIGGGIAGSLVAQNALQAQATRSAIKVNAIAPVVASAPTAPRLAGDSNSAIVAAVKRVGPAVVTVINTMPRQQIFGLFGESVQQPKGSG